MSSLTVGKVVRALPEGYTPSAIEFAVLLIVLLDADRTESHIIFTDEGKLSVEHANKRTSYGCKAEVRADEMISTFTSETPVTAPPASFKVIDGDALHLEELFKTVDTKKVRESVMGKSEPTPAPEESTPRSAGRFSVLRKDRESVHPVQTEPEAQRKLAEEKAAREQAEAETKELRERLQKVEADRKATEAEIARKATESRREAELAELRKQLEEAKKAKPDPEPATAVVKIEIPPAQPAIPAKTGIDAVTNEQWAIIAILAGIAAFLIGMYFLA
jgi:hypothetical protein